MLVHFPRYPRNVPYTWKKHIYGCSKMVISDEAANTSLLLDPKRDQNNDLSD